MLLLFLAVFSKTAVATVIPPVRLEWNANPESDIAGYLISYGTGSGKYETTINAGLKMSVDVSGLAEGVTYYFVVSAFNTQGLASVVSDEVVLPGIAAPSNPAPESIISSPSGDMSITAGGSVSFTGSGDDPDEDAPLTYHWAFGSGSGIPDSTSNSPGSLQFNNPGVHQVTFTVTDSEGLSDPTPATLRITVTAPPPPFVPNEPPESTIYQPSGDINITVGGRVGFSGVGDDPEGDALLTYLWEFSDGSGIGDSISRRLRGLKFENPGVYQVKFTVTDSQGLSDPTPAVRTITVGPPPTAVEPAVPNTAPESVIALPSGDLVITEGDQVGFSGSGSDPDGDPALAFHWSFGSGSGVGDSTSRDAGSVQFDNPGVYQVTLTVTDSKGLADPTPAVRTITVMANHAPESTITSPLESRVVITAGEELVFAGSGSDPDGDAALAYHWSFGSGSGIGDFPSQVPGIRRFEIPGVYQVTFTVTDSRGLADPSPATVDIIVAAVEGAGDAERDDAISSPPGDVAIPVGGTVYFSGKRSDYGRRRVREGYLWNFGNGSGISDSSSRSPGLRRFNHSGVFEVTLTIIDSNGVPGAFPARRTIRVGAANPSQSR